MNCGSLLTGIQGLEVAGSVKISRRWLSEKQILDLLQTTSYSDSEGDEMEDSNDKDFIPLHNSSGESEEELILEGNYH